MNDEEYVEVIRELAIAVKDATAQIVDSLDEIEERLRRINDSIDEHNETIQMIDVKNRSRL